MRKFFRDLASTDRNVSGFSTFVFVVGVAFLPVALIYFLIWATSSLLSFAVAVFAIGLLVRRPPA